MFGVNNMFDCFIICHIQYIRMFFMRSLLLTKCKLEEVVSGPEVALLTCKQMMKLWKTMFESTVDL